MSSLQFRLVVVATLLSESAWLYATVAVIGVLFGLGNSPLGWTAIVVLLGSSYIVARGIAMVAMPITAAYAIQMVAGAIVVYLAIGTQTNTEIGVLDVAWAAHLYSGTYVAGSSEAIGSVRGVLLGVMVSTVLWWRGGRTASHMEPLENLALGFRLGLMSLAVAVTLDIFNDADLNIFSVMFLFFASGLAGLSIGHLLPASPTAIEERVWLRIIAGVVSAILVIGLMLSLFGSSVLSWLSAAILTVMGWFTTVMFYLVILPIAYLVGWLTQFGIYLVSLIGAEDHRVEQPGMSLADQMQDLQEHKASEWPAMLVQALEYLAIAIVVIILLYVLARAFRRRYRLSQNDAAGVHESVREDADPAYDLARLLLNLLPSGVGRAGSHRKYRLPDDESGIVDVFRIYFGMLTLAEERGHHRSAAETPAEYQRTLEDIFPNELVQRATRAFNRACYGHRSSSPEDIAEMRSTLDQLRSSSG